MLPPPRTRLTYPLAVALAWACVNPLAAQRVAAALDAADTVRQGERLRLTFTFEDVDARAVAAPELVGLRVIGGPSRRSQVSISNGVRRSRAALSYHVVAEQPGLAYVLPLAVAHAGDTLRSEALSVFVTADPDFVPLDAPAVAEPRRPRPPTIKM